MWPPLLSRLVGRPRLLASLASLASLAIPIGRKWKIQLASLVRVHRLVSLVSLGLSHVLIFATWGPAWPASPSGQRLLVQLQ